MNKKILSFLIILLLVFNLNLINVLASVEGVEGLDTTNIEEMREAMLKTLNMQGSAEDLEMIEEKGDLAEDIYNQGMDKYEKTSDPMAKGEVMAEMMKNLIELKGEGAGDKNEQDSNQDMSVFFEQIKDKIGQNTANNNFIDPNEFDKSWQKLNSKLQNLSSDKQEELNIGLLATRHERIQFRLQEINKLRNEVLTLIAGDEDVLLTKMRKYRDELKSLRDELKELVELAKQIKGQLE